VFAVSPTARAEFVQRDTVGIVATILGRRIRPLAALAAGEVNDLTVLFPGHY